MSLAHPPPEVRVGEPAFVVETLAADVEAEARQVLAQGRPFSIAIPGGSVAKSCFPRLAELELDWSLVEFFWVDERGVLPTSLDSNYGLARSLWLEPADVPGGRIHRMRGEAGDLARAAREYSLELANVAGTPPRLDYALLGVGADGHVASLFPGRLAPGDGGSVLAIEDAPRPPARRLSLSMSVLIDAGRVAIVAFGEEKAAAIEAVERAESALPVARVARGARRCLIVVDRAAAGRG